jgi:signal transduction histidine kinase
VRSPLTLGRVPLRPAAEVVVAALLLAANLALFGRRHEAIPLLVVETVPVAFRLSWPVPALFTAAGAALVASAIGLPPSPANFAAILWLLAAVAYEHRPRVAVPTLVAIAAGTVVVVREQEMVAMAFQLALVGAAWSLGQGARTRRALEVALHQGAESAQRARREEASRAAADARASMAREVHDVVAHSLSVIVVQAGAGRRVAAESPQEAREALASIERTGREALGEIRRLLGVLRSGDERETRRPQPGLDRLDALLEGYRASGLAVAASVAGALDDLPVTVDLSAYRIVQEALTNCLRHARGADARVSVARDERELVVEVVNGLGVTAAERNGAGHGLAGMRERVALCGGEFAAGPLPDGGWRVRAALPLAAP